MKGKDSIKALSGSSDPSRIERMACMAYGMAEGKDVKDTMTFFCW